MAGLPKLDLIPIPTKKLNEQEMLGLLRTLHDNQKRLLLAFEDLRKAVETRLARAEFSGGFLSMGG